MSVFSCCPDADFTFLSGGVQVEERNVQDESSTVQFFPYRAITSVRYYYNRADREGVISIWIASQGSPGAGGLSFRWRFPCGESGRGVYTQLLERLATV